MLIELIERKHNEILRTILENHTSDIQTEEYNKLINACFYLADFIVKNKNGEYIDSYETKSQSAIYVLREISGLIDTKEFEYELDCFLHCANLGGRLREATLLFEEYLKTKHGLVEVISNTQFIDNVRSLTS